MEVIATILIILGGFLCCTNFYLSFLRYPIFRARGGKIGNYKWSSGIPIFGSALVALSLITLWKHSVALPIALILIFIDTGGIHWFAGTMIYHAIKKEK